MSGVHLVVKEYAEGVQVNVESDGKINEDNTKIAAAFQSPSFLLERQELLAAHLPRTFPKRAAFAQNLPRQQHCSIRKGALVFADYLLNWGLHDSHTLLQCLHWSIRYLLQSCSLFGTILGNLNEGRSYL